MVYDEHNSTQLAPVEFRRYVHGGKKEHEKEDELVAVVWIYDGVGEEIVEKMTSYEEVENVGLSKALMMKERRMKKMEWSVEWRLKEDAQKSSALAKHGRLVAQLEGLLGRVRVKDIAMKEADSSYSSTLSAGPISFSCWWVLNIIVSVSSEVHDNKEYEEEDHERIRRSSSMIPCP
ncbi:hypothetical protein Tco_1352970 [Tanacetum coccineum]